MKEIITVKNLKKSFGNNIVIDNASFSIEKNQNVVIIGPSGGGKSTILRCLNGLEKATSGEILYKGNDISQLSKVQLRKMRRKVGMVFQQFNLFPHMTVLENIVFSPVKLGIWKNEDAEIQGNMLLEKVGLEKKSSAYPASLSGGQQQRVAIARALAMEPEVLLFDEPTSALDPEMVGEVLDVIEDLANSGKVTMVVVTHELGLAKKIGDKVLFVDQGTILDQGSPSHIFKDSINPRTRDFVSKVL